MAETTSPKVTPAKPFHRRVVVETLANSLVTGYSQVPPKATLFQNSGIKGPNSTEAKAVWHDIEKAGIITEAVKGSNTTQNLTAVLALESDDEASSENAGEKAFVIHPKILEDKHCPLSATVAHYKLVQVILDKDKITGRGRRIYKLYPVKKAVRLFFQAMALSEKKPEDKTWPKLEDLQKAALEKTELMSMGQFFELTSRMKTMKLMEDKNIKGVAMYDSSKLCMKEPYYGLPLDDPLVVAAKDRAKSPGEANMRSQSKKARLS